MTAVHMTPVSMQPGVVIVKIESQERRINSYIGQDRSRWRTGIPLYRAVLYREAYPGIDLKFYARGHHLEYDVIVKPGAIPDQMHWQFTGVDKLEVTAVGDLALHLPGGGRQVQRRPVVYQEIAGRCVSRHAKFQSHPQGATLTCGFDVAAYDRRYSLVVDPILVPSTYLGEEGYDLGAIIRQLSPSEKTLDVQSISTSFGLIAP